MMFFRRMTPLDRLRRKVIKAKRVLAQATIDKERADVVEHNARTDYVALAANLNVLEAVYRPGGVR